jgi:hypothetical protein
LADDKTSLSSATKVCFLSRDIAIKILSLIDVSFEPDCECSDTGSELEKKKKSLDLALPKTKIENVCIT